jgi:hypothetical protein
MTLTDLLEEIDSCPCPTGWCMACAPLQDIAGEAQPRLFTTLWIGGEVEGFLTWKVS